MIINNELAAGSSHLESELADLLGMSRTPVREAALLLESQGLVEVRPRRGIRILPLSAVDLAETYEILTELEGLATEKAAVHPLSVDQIAVFENALADMAAALEVDDRDAWAVADKRFHDHLVAMAKNQRLQAIVASMNDQVHRARMLTVRLRPKPTRSLRDHRKLLDAIKAGDAALARAIHTAHRTEAKALIISLLEEHGFRQV